MRKISLFILILFITAPLFSESKNFYFSSDRTSISLAKGNELTILEGNAEISSNDTNITADYIELFGDNFRYARCRGNVLVADKTQGIKITTEELFFDRDKEIMTINSYAEMVDQKNEIVVKGNYFENHGKDNITIVQIGVRILKASENDSMVGRSEYARYDRDNESLILSGMPVVYWKNDEYHATRIIINIDTDEINLSGEVSGTIHTEEEKEVPADE